MTAIKNEYLEAARICTAHGVMGGLKLEHMCDSAEVLCSLKTVYLRTGGGYSAKKVISASVAGRFVNMRLEGITTREEAIALRGKSLYLHRDDLKLPEGVMFIADMIGLPVIDADDGRLYGEIADISDATGRRIYTVRTGDGKEVLIPGVQEFIKEIDPDGMRISPIPGFFDAADEV